VSEDPIPPRKRVLFIAWFFPPSAGAGVQRTARYVKYLRDFSYEPIVVAPAEDAFRRDPLALGEDRTFLSEIPPDVKVYRAPACQPYGLLRLLKRLRLLWLWSFFIRPDEKLTWALSAVPIAVKAARRERVDLICQNVGPWSTALVGVMVKALTQKPLVFDVRDPWTQWAMGRWPTRLHYGIERLLERWVLARADAVATLGPTYRDEMLRANPGLDPRRVVTVPNGFDLPVPPPASPATRNEHLRIVHAGKFYDTWGRERRRNALTRALKAAYDITLGRLRYSPRRLDASEAGPRRLMEGLALLKQRDPEAAAQLRLEFIGRVHPSVARLADELGLREQLSLPGRMPHTDCVRRMAEADLLFLPLFRWADAAPMGVLPLKVYEYMASGKGILCAASEGDMKETLKPAGTAIFVNPDDPADFADRLADAHRRWSRGELTFSPDWTYIAGFHRRTLTGRLARLMDDVLARYDWKVNERGLNDEY
jgi:glycosyltransferase involved in cell wall biosynthesis